MIVRQGAWQIGVGMIVGLTLALGVAQLMMVVLFDVQPRDPVIFGGVVAVLSVRRPARVPHPRAPRHARRSADRRLRSD